MFSIWEHEQFLKFDIVIIGSGITGLSTACSLLERNPGLKVVILERGMLPSGASTKNAGFACIGSFTEKLYDLKLMGEDMFLQLIESRIKGLHMLRSRVGDEVLEFEQYGGYELILNSMPAVTQDELDAMNTVLTPLFPKPIFQFAPQAQRTFGFGQTQQLIHNYFEGQINTGKMIAALMQKAQALGAKLLNGAEVKSINDSGTHVEITCTLPLYAQGVSIKALKAAVCTNAFLNQLLPEAEVKPGRGQVICTKPVQGLKFKGVFSIDEGFYYFRNYGERVIFGGGRNLDFEGERTTTFGINPTIHERLLQYLTEIILPAQPFEVEYHWSGIMAFHEQKQPLIKQVQPNVWAAGRLNGMGVALGSQVGENLAINIIA
jgi:glycine/D-amino acid oxidase-like deaminating enzyme